MMATKVPKSVWSAMQTDGMPRVTEETPPAWFPPLPKDVKRIYLGMQDHVHTSVLKSRANEAPEPTATGVAAVAMAGAAAAGVLGVMAAL